MAIPGGLWAGWSLAHTAAITNGITLRQQLTPDDLQGRVNTTGRLPEDLVNDQVERLAALSAVGAGLWALTIVMHAFVWPRSFLVFSRFSGP